MKTQYTFKELLETIRSLQNIFEIVRLVDPVNCVTYTLNDDDVSLIPEKLPCFSKWKRETRCEHCSSTSALNNRRRTVKYQMVDQEFYYIVSKYIQYEKMELTLEIVSRIDQDFMVGGEGVGEFIDKITSFNDVLYTDALTNVYNRRYVHDHLHLIDKPERKSQRCFAIVDIDNFKHINDTFGHIAGDEALKALSKLLRSRVSARRGDFVVRYGGDEFLLTLHNLSPEVFSRRMRELLYRASNIRLKEYPGLHISLSIGGVSQSEYPDACYADLIAVADERLYKAKRTGRNREVTSTS